MRLVVLNEKGEQKHEPRNLNEAQFSIPFCVATAILRGLVFPDVLTEETLRDARILDLSHRITAEATPEKDEFMKREGIPPVDIDIYTTEGKVYSGSEPFVKGHPQNPMSFDDCVKKFRRCATFAAKPLSKTNLEKFLRQAGRLEKVGDVRGIFSNLG
jgi:2-methylcitrate dehydratase PrpD